jgi:hypothetical protein
MHMDAADGRKLSEAVLNERRRRAVKMRLSGATIAKTARLCEIGERTVWTAAKAHSFLAGSTNRKSTAR